MANPERGEMAVTIGGVSYTLKSTIGSKIAVEAMFSKAEGRKVRWAEIVSELNKGSAEHTRAVIWSTFQAHHPEITLERAGELSDLLEAEQVYEAMAQTVIAGEPDPQDVTALAAPSNGRPPTAQGIARTRKGGTGAVSSSGRGRSV